MLPSFVHSPGRPREATGAALEGLVLGGEPRGGAPAQVRAWGSRRRQAQPQAESCIRSLGVQGRQEGEDGPSGCSSRTPRLLGEGPEFLQGPWLWSRGSPVFPTSLPSRLPLSVWLLPWGGKAARILLFPWPRGDLTTQEPEKTRVPSPRLIRLGARGLDPECADGSALADRVCRLGAPDLRPHYGLLPWCPDWGGGEVGCSLFPAAWGQGPEFMEPGRAAGLSPVNCRLCRAGRTPWGGAGTSRAMLRFRYSSGGSGATKTEDAAGSQVWRGPRCPEKQWGACDRLLGRVSCACARGSRGLGQRDWGAAPAVGGLVCLGGQRGSLRMSEPVPSTVPRKLNPLPSPP